MRFLLDSVALKLMSLGLAALLWYVIAGEKSSEMGVVVPLELQNFPKELELTGEAVDSVEVRLRASPGIIRRLVPSDISAQVDVAGTAEGERVVHLTPESIHVPYGVRVVKINPSTLTLSFERTVQKTVPVRPRLLGHPAPGFEVGDIVSEPPQVRVIGPRTRVQEVESAFTEPVSVTGAGAPVTADVNVGLEDPLLRIQTERRVRVTVTVREVEEERVLEGVDVDGVTRPETVAVTVAGPASAVRGLTLDQLRVRPRAGVPGAGKVPLVAEIVPPHPGLVVRAITPSEVLVRH